MLLKCMLWVSIQVRRPILIQGNTVTINACHKLSGLSTTNLLAVYNCEFHVFWVMDVCISQCIVYIHVLVLALSCLYLCNFTFNIFCPQLTVHSRTHAQCVMTAGKCYYYEYCGFETKDVESLRHHLINTKAEHMEYLTVKVSEMEQHSNKAKQLVWS